MNQIALHNKIDKTLKAGPEKTTVDVVSRLISANADGKRYFFASADGSWIEWLWENGFLNAIKEKEVLTNGFRYTPELEYLVTVSDTHPEKVVDVMLQVPVVLDSQNSEVAERFIWISSKLKADQIARIVPKIRDEEWARLMGRHGHSAYSYLNMIKALVQAKDYDSLIILAAAILMIRSKDEMKESGNGFGTDNPFYLDDIDQTTIFENIVEVDDDHAEAALALMTAVMRKIVLLGDEKPTDEPFEVGELFYLYDVDFFSVSVGEKNNFSYRDSARNLAASIKELSEQLIGKKCGDAAEVQRIYKTYIDSLPFSRSMWRLRLFVVSLCPEVFKAKIQEYLLSIFEDKKWSSLISGAEYEWLLKKAFGVLPEEIRNTYIDQVFAFFGDPKKESFYKAYGRDLLSCIDSFLDDPKRQKSEELFGGRPDPDHVPEPTIKESYAGMINSKSPIGEDTLNGLSVADLVARLKNEWSPANIRKLDKEKSFFNPINAEGLSEVLQKNISARFAEYIQNAELFFDRAFLHPQYTYAFLRGIYDVIRDQNFKNGKQDLTNLLAFLNAIVSSGNENQFDSPKKVETSDEGWIANWSWVHNSMADVFKDMLGENKDAPLIDFKKNRKLSLDIIQYLLNYKASPTVEDNTREHGGDPFSVAINSVRGKALQALTLFIAQDTASFAKDAKIKIANDVKDIYENLLFIEDTYAIMFLFGHFLAFFYYRDKKWIRKLLPKIFPYDTKKELYIASWEGYLASSLYREVFEELADYYAYAIKMAPSQEERRYFKDVDESLATHIALAYMYFENFNLKSKLFRLFWKTPNEAQHEEFVSFIGRHALSKDTDFQADKKISIEKIKELWDWILKNCSEPKTFAEFGFWINEKINPFDSTEWLAEHAYKTLKKSGGRLGWEYGLMGSIINFAKEVPEEALRILSVYLLDPNTDPSLGASGYLHGEVYTAFDILYANPLTKQKTRTLINKLLPLRNGRFWGLKGSLKK